jgi:hypothetical protein
MYGGDERGYVGIGDDLRRRVTQRLVLRSSSVTTGTGAVGLHPDHVRTVDADDLPAARLVHAMRDDQRLGHHAPAIADLLDLRVQEQIRISALSGRERNASTCSSRAPQIRLTSDFDTLRPRVSTS